MANEIVQQTGKAGELYIPALGQTVRLVEWREDSYRDSVSQDAGAITQGLTLDLFRDLTNKNVQHCNLKTQRRIPSGSTFVLNRIGVLIAQAFSNTIVALDDILKVAYDGVLTFKINDRLVAEGPLVNFPSGYGMVGSTTANDRSLVTTSVASPAAAPNLLVAQTVTDTDDLNGEIVFKDDKWITGSSVMPTLAGRVVITADLHGLIKKPQGQ